MEVGRTTAEVTVTADAPLVQQGSSTGQYGVNQKALDELPLPNQSAMGLLLVILGVLGNSGTEQVGPTVNPLTPGVTVFISVENRHSPT